MLQSRALRNLTRRLCRSTANWRAQKLRLRITLAQPRQRELRCAAQAQGTRDEIKMMMNDAERLQFVFARDICAGMRMMA
jgi:hypothetical protein